MATFAAIFDFSDEATSTGTLTAGSDSSEIVLGTSRKFAVTATAAFNIAFGNASMSAATSSNFEFPGSAVFTLSTANSNDRVRIHNPGAGSLTYWLQPLAA